MFRLLSAVAGALLLGMAAPLVDLSAPAVQKAIKTCNRQTHN